MPKKKQLTVKEGAIVAFNTLPDAAWFDVVKMDGFEIEVREHGTNYASQFTDKSLVKQVRAP